MLYPRRIIQGYYKNLFKFYVISAVDGSMVKNSELVKSRRILKGDFVDEP